MENKIEYGLDYLKSDQVWRDIREECNILLEDQKTQIRWVSRISRLIPFFVGSAAVAVDILLLKKPLLSLIIPPTLALILATIIHDEILAEGLTQWQRSSIKMLRVNLDPDKPENKVIIESFGDVHPSLSKITEIHSGFGEDFLRLSDSGPSLHWYHYRGGGSYGIERSKKPINETVAEKYKRIIDDVKQLQRG